MDSDVWSDSRKEQESDVQREAVHLSQQVDILIETLHGKKIPDLMLIMKLKVYMERVSRQLDVYMYLCEKEQKAQK